MSDAGKTCVAEMVSCASAGAAATVPRASTAAFSVAFIGVFLPVGRACYLALGRNQSLGKRHHRAEGAVDWGILESPFGLLVAIVPVIVVVAVVAVVVTVAVVSEHA